MKTLLMIRHAKSNGRQLHQTDFERCLSESGKSEAITISEKLVHKISSIDLIISSTALRTKQTTEYFRKATSLPPEKIIYSEDLYLATSEKIEEVISSVGNEFDIVLLVCHNPGITDFVNTLTDTVKIDEMPTCGVFCVEANINRWEDFRNAKKRFLFFDHPKKH